MKPEEELLAVVRKLRNPLEYAAGLPPERVQVMRDLEKTLNNIAAQYPKKNKALDNFKNHLSGLDEIDGAKRMERVVLLLAKLDLIETKRSFKKKGRP